MTQFLTPRRHTAHVPALLAAVTAMLLPSLAPSATLAQGMPTPTPTGAAEALTPAQKDAALAGARGAVERLSKATTLPAVADALTNKSAAMVGIMMSAVAGMVVSFSSMGPPSSAKSPSTESPAQMKKDYDALMARYGLNDDDKTTSQDKDLPPALTQHGRQFLTDISNFMDKVGGQDKKSVSKKDPIMSADGITYTVISPTRVHLTPKPKAGAKAEPPADALLEDGQWRIDMGDMKQMMHTENKDPFAAPPLPKGVLSTENSPLAQDFFDAVGKHNAAQIRHMLAQHPNLVKAQNLMGETPLFDAVFWGDRPMIKLLLASGADVNRHSKGGQTPLDQAEFFQKDDTQLLALLKQHGAKRGAGIGQTKTINSK